jgi:hypothetical protein
VDEEPVNNPENGCERSANNGNKPELLEFFRCNYVLLLIWFSA